MDNRCSMDVKLYLCLTLVSIFIAEIFSTNTCEISDRRDCIYTITCVKHAGSAWNPECDFEPHVTFIIKNSTAETLTAGFFGSTNFDSRVRVFEAIGNNWTNIDPLTFRYYSKSLIADLSRNHIKNIRNEAFKNLVALESLDLSQNEIEMLSPKSLFISETKAELSSLDLSSNLLTELTGDVFSCVPELRRLFLQGNKISSLTEDCFTNLRNLSILRLNQNQLTSLNMTFINLKSLKELDLSYNALTKVSGFELNRLTSLESVNISHNTIEFIESNCFNQAFNLRTVDLSYNFIKSSIETVMFINNNKLKHLNFYNNRITKIQENAFKHNVLQDVNFENNNITGEITEGIFRGLQNITKLNLSYQNITALKSNAFDDLVNLSYLNLTNNRINIIENSSFVKALSLKILEISNNNLSSISFLSNCLFNLTELYMRNNTLTIIPSNAFDSQVFLLKLDIRMNKITTIEQFSLPLKNLQYLFLTENRLAGTLKSNVISPAKFLRNLDLSSFNLTHVEELAFVNMPVLARLNISHNKIKSIHPNNFNGTDNMYSLDVSYNKLTCFHLNESGLSNLKALYLNNNQLNSISKTLLGMASLLYVDLSNNNISNLADVNFTMLPNLKVLHLSSNNLQHFNNFQTNSLTKLTDLGLASNHLSEINLSYFKDLVLVDLSSNLFSSLNYSFFDNLDYLQSLDISHNNISKLDPGTFRNVKILKLLNLSHNHLTNIRYGTFKGLHRTEVLDLSYNHLTYIDVDVFHVCPELKRLIIDHNYIKYLDIERLVMMLTELTTVSLGGNPISCKEIVRTMRNVNKNIMLRYVEVTSVNKIYHEDNVHGIKCGDSNGTNVYKPREKDLPESSSLSSVVIWCLVLGIIVLIAVMIARFVYRRNKSIRFNEDSHSRLQLSSTLSFPISDQERDLLE